MGDSLLAWHSLAGKSIPDMVSRELQEPVVDRSVSAARIIYKLPVSGAAGMNIRKQYTSGEWDWVIVNGGGNDLWFGCGCFACDRKMDKLISSDGRSGAIPAMLSDLRATGARIIYVGYLRSPGAGSLIEHCRDEGDELETRITRLAELDAGIFFLSNRDLVPHGDRSHHAPDMIHPSVKASGEIGRKVAEIIRAN
ncbi:SGNH/GDSL hydrolase family protein [Leisingera caerulea]|uniref:SGNH/GDSL hydrolase family protein n=1 Tax=Leisingera caerulea TaxID=506591 RepID=UPI0021A298D0|nr:SGNH/GDSL hydrolase family protein [Leisingera caerulea]